MPRTDRRNWTLSQRIYRVLLMAYPEEFRREYGPQMEQAFRDLCREAPLKGEKAGFVQLWVRALLDLGKTAFVVRINALGKEVGVNDYRLAGVGFAALSAPLFFVVASLLKYGLGIGLLFDPLEAFLSVAGRKVVFNAVSPFVFLGGLSLALALNIYAVARLHVSREDGTVVGTLRIKPGLCNIAVALVSLLLLMTLAGYAFLENFTHG